MVWFDLFCMRMTRGQMNSASHPSAIIQSQHSGRESERPDVVLNIFRDHRLFNWSNSKGKCVRFFGASGTTLPSKKFLRDQNSTSLLDLVRLELRFISIFSSSRIADSKKISIALRIALPIVGIGVVDEAHQNESFWNSFASIDRKLGVDRWNELHDHRSELWSGN